MTDKPISFIDPMIRALFDGRKTQTRRIYKVPAGSYVEQGRVWAMTDGCQFGDEALPHVPGDRLWVRNNWRFGAWNYDAADIAPDHPDGSRQASRITLTVTEVQVQRIQEISEADAWAEGCKRGQMWDSGKGYFPADERSPCGMGWFGWDSARDWFADLWDSLYAMPRPRYDADMRITHYESFPWGGESRTETYQGKPHYITANPWVTATTFTVHKCNIDQMEAA